MSPDIELLYECGRAGIIFRPLGGRLRPCGCDLQPIRPGGIAPDLRQRVEANREALLQLVCAALSVGDDNVGCDTPDSTMDGSPPG